jgi:hypothetical protein
MRRVGCRERYVDSGEELFDGELYCVAARMPVVTEQSCRTTSAGRPSSSDAAAPTACEYASPVLRGFPMMRTMLVNIKKRAERHADTGLSSFTSVDGVNASVTGGD